MIDVRGVVCIGDRHPAGGEDLGHNLVGIGRLGGRPVERHPQVVDDHPGALTGQIEGVAAPDARPAPVTRATRPWQQPVCLVPGAMDYEAVLIHTAFTWTYSSMECRLSSLPQPLIFEPPNGMAGSKFP